eukprot:5785915-Lingulodinium_polyedra.AAC.1
MAGQLWEDLKSLAVGARREALSEEFQMQAAEFMIIPVDEHRPQSSRNFVFSSASALCSALRDSTLRSKDLYRKEACSGDTVCTQGPPCRTSCHVVVQPLQPVASACRGLNCLHDARLNAFQCE